MVRFVTFLSTSFLFFLLILGLSGINNTVLAVNSCSGSVSCGTIVSAKGHCSLNSNFECVSNDVCTQTGTGICIGAGGTACQSGAPAGVCFCSGADCNSYGSNFICLPGCGSCVVNGQCVKNVSLPPSTKTPSPTQAGSTPAPIQCGYCAGPDQCSQQGGSYSESNGYCAPGTGCCAIGGGSSGGGNPPPPPPPPPSYNCGNSCQNDQQCQNSSTGNPLARCFSGVCRNMLCPGSSGSGKNCPCSGQLTCGQQPVFGQGCDATSQQGFVNVPDSQSNNCNQYANNAGSSPKGYQYCIPKNPANGYSFASPGCTDLGVRRLAKPDGTTTGFTQADIDLACQQAPVTTTPRPTIPPAPQCSAPVSGFSRVDTSTNGTYTGPTYVPVPAGATGFDLVADDADASGSGTDWEISFIVNGTAVKRSEWPNNPCMSQTLSHGFPDGWWDLCSTFTLFSFQAPASRTPITSLVIQLKRFSGSGTTAHLYQMYWEYCGSNHAWWQVTGGDAITNGSLQSNVSGSNNFMLDNAQGFPGNVLYGTSVNLFNGLGGNVSSKEWLTNSTYLGKTYDYNYFINALPGSVTLNNVGNSLAQTDFDGGIASGSYTYFKAEGNTTISSDISISGARKVILFVNGDLTINGKINIVNHGQGFFMVIVSGNINVAGAVTNAAGYALEGIYETDRFFNTGASAVDLNMRGTVVSWGGVEFQRDLGGGNAVPAETFEYDPMLTLLFPRDLVKDSVTWQEVIP